MNFCYEVMMIYNSNALEIYLYQDNMYYFSLLFNSIMNIVDHLLFLLEA